MPNDPTADLERYLKAMGGQDFIVGLRICAAIEKRYGVYGSTPQEVHRKLARLSKQQLKQQEPTPNVPHHQTGI